MVCRNTSGCKCVRVLKTGNVRCSAALQIASAECSASTRPRHIEPEHLSPNLVRGHRCAQTIPHTNFYPPVFGFNMPGTCKQYFRILVAHELPLVAFLALPLITGLRHPCATPEPHSLLAQYGFPSPQVREMPSNTEGSRILIAHDPTLSLTGKEIHIINSSADVVRGSAGHRQYQLVQ